MPKPSPGDADGSGARRGADTRDTVAMAREAAEQNGGAAPGAPLEVRRGVRRAGHRRAREHAKHLRVCRSPRMPQPGMGHATYSNGHVALCAFISPRRALASQPAFGQVLDTPSVSLTFGVPHRTCHPRPALPCRARARGRPPRWLPRPHRWGRRLSCACATGARASPRSSLCTRARRRSERRRMRPCSRWPAVRLRARSACSRWACWRRTPPRTPPGPLRVERGGGAPPRSPLRLRRQPRLGQRCLPWATTHLRRASRGAAACGAALKPSAAKRASPRRAPAGTACFALVAATTRTRFTSSDATRRTTTSGFCSLRVVLPPRWRRRVLLAARAPPSTQQQHHCRYAPAPRASAPPAARCSKSQR